MFRMGPCNRKWHRKSDPSFSMPWGCYFRCMLCGATHFWFPYPSGEIQRRWLQSLVILQWAAIRRWCEGSPNCQYQLSSCVDTLYCGKCDSDTCSCWWVHDNWISGTTLCYSRTSCFTHTYWLLWPEHWAGVFGIPRSSWIDRNGDACSGVMFHICAPKVYPLFVSWDGLWYIIVTFSIASLRMATHSGMHLCCY